MDLDFSAEQDMLREMVRGLCTTASPLERVRDLEDDPIGFSRELWSQLGELDLIGLMVPTEFGGSGMSAIDGIVLYEELGRGLVPLPHFVSAVVSAGLIVARRRRCAERRMAPQDRIRRGDPHAGVARTPRWIRAPRGADHRDPRR